MTDLVEMLRIRCTKETKTSFKRYAAPYETYNAALEALIEDSRKLDVVRRDKIK